MRKFIALTYTYQFTQKYEHVIYTLVDTGNCGLALESKICARSEYYFVDQQNPSIGYLEMLETKGKNIVLEI